MAILSDVKIIEKIYDKELVINPFIYDHVQPSSIDLTLSSEIKKIKTGITETVNVFDKDMIEKIYETSQVEKFVLAPGDFIIGQIRETITIPSDCNGNIQNRNSLIRMGIDVGLSSYINPGYSGKLPIVIKNIGNISIELTSGMRICQLIIQEVSPITSNDYSSKNDAKYHNEKDITLPKMHTDLEFVEFLKSKGASDKFNIKNDELSTFFEKRLKEKSTGRFGDLTNDQKRVLGLR